MAVLRVAVMRVVGMVRGGGVVLVPVLVLPELAAAYATVGARALLRASDNNVRRRAPFRRLLQQLQGALGGGLGRLGLGQPC